MEKACVHKYEKSLVEAQCLKRVFASMKKGRFKCVFSNVRKYE